MLLRVSDVSMSSATYLAVALLALALAGCGATATTKVYGSGTESPGSAGAPGAFGLPAPEQMLARLAPPRGSSTTSPGWSWFRDGSGYEDLLPSNRVVRSVPRVVLNSNGSGSSGGIADLSYAIWRFTVAGYDGAPTLRPIWDTAPLDSASVWVGVANFTSQTWNWFGCAPGLAANLGDTTPYIDGAGNMLVVVLLSGMNSGSLLRLRLGDIVLSGAVKATPQAGVASLNTWFDASAVVLNGAVPQDYEWDLDGDGVYETDTGSLVQANSLYTTVGQTIASLRIATDEGPALTVSAPTVHVLNGTWELQTLASPGGSDSYYYPQIAIVGGRPAVAMVHSFPPDAETFPDGWYAVEYHAAADAQATSWSGGGEAANNANRPVQLADLLEVNGAPALCYRDESNQIGYTRASDATGSSWGSPLLIASAANGSSDASMAIVNGKPAIAYSFDDGAGGLGLGYLQALDADGGSWPAPLGIRDNVSGQVSLRLVDGRPGIAFYDSFSNSVEAVKSSDPDGAAGTWSEFVAVGALGSGGYAEMGELSGYLVIGMQRDEPSVGLKAAIWSAADAQGNGPWYLDNIDADLGTGYSLSLGGPCLDHDGVCCYQSQGAAPGLWLSYLDWSGVVSSLIETVDGGAGLGYNCEMTVCEGVPMIVYEDRNNGSVRFAVLR